MPVKRSKNADVFTSQDTVRHILASGMRVLLCVRQHSPVVTTMMWYGVGSRQDPPDRTGLSHFLEHMMFKRTRKFGKGEIDALTTRLGGFNNAFTSLDYTAFYSGFSVDRWWPALEIEAERMLYARFDEEEFQLEKQVIAEEINMELDSPWGRLRREVEALSFPQHPYGNPVLGRKEDVLGLDLDDLVAHYKKFYVPENAVLVVVGDIDREKVLRRAEDLFSVPAKRLPTQPVLPRAERTGNRVTLHGPNRVARLLFSFPAPEAFNEDLFAAYLLEKVLAEGRMSRLNLKLIEETRIASLVAAEVTETGDPFSFFIEVELTDPRKTEAAVSQLFSVLKSVGRGELRVAELDRAKNQCINQFLSGLETSFDQAFWLGHLETLGGFEWVSKYLKRLQELDLAHVCEVARRYLVESQAVVGQMLPNGSVST